MGLCLSLERSFAELLGLSLVNFSADQGRIFLGARFVVYYEQKGEERQMMKQCRQMRYMSIIYVPVVDLVGVERHDAGPLNPTRQMDFRAQ